MKRVTRILMICTVLLLLCASPVLSGGGPPSPLDAVRPAASTPDDTNEGSSWDDPEHLEPGELGDDAIAESSEIDVPFRILGFPVWIVEIIRERFNFQQTKEELNLNDKSSRRHYKKRR